jgi:hypothetical protein
LRYGWGETLALASVFYCVGASMELFMIKTGFYEVRRSRLRRYLMIARHPSYSPCAVTVFKQKVTKMEAIERAEEMRRLDEMREQRRALRASQASIDAGGKQA